MMSWWHYLLLVNLYLVLFFGFYKVFLHRETFFQLNRIYLVTASLLSFFIPLMQLDWIRDLFITQRVHQTIYSAVGPQLYKAQAVESTPVTFGQIAAYVYIAGAALLLGRLVYQLLLLKKLINSDSAPSAFSFFKKIKVDAALADQQTIIEHEQVHSRQWHSADVLLIEAVMIINWFNPVVYFYRKAIKHVHEYIADRKAIETGTSKSEYAMLLLSQTFGIVPHELTNNFFNHSLLKQRILMLNQSESNRRALLKYGLSAPLFAAMLILSSATVNNSKLIRTINKKTEQVFIRKVKLNVTDDAIPETIVTEHAAIPGYNKTAKADSKLNMAHFTTEATVMETLKDSTVKNPDGSKFRIVEIRHVSTGEREPKLMIDTSLKAPGTKKVMKVFMFKYSTGDSLNTISATSTGPHTFAARQLIIKMNGKTISHDEMSRINPGEIESMNVIRGTVGKDSIMVKMRVPITPTKNTN